MLDFSLLCPRNLSAFSGGTAVTERWVWCNSLFSRSGKPYFFCSVISLKTTIPLCTERALSDYPVYAKMSKFLPDWYWSHPGRPQQPGIESHASLASNVPQCHQAHLGTDVSAASSLEHWDVYAEPWLLSCSRVQLEAVILQRALCVCC